MTELILIVSTLICVISFINFEYNEQHYSIYLCDYFNSFFSNYSFICNWL